MKKKIFVCLFCVVLIVGMTSCTPLLRMVLEKNQAEGKKNYPAKFKKFWSYALPDKEEVYGYFSLGLSDMFAYYVYDVSMSETDFAFEQMNKEEWQPRIEYHKGLLDSVPDEYLIDYSHDLYIFYTEKQKTTESPVDKLYVVFDNNENRMKILDLRP